MNSSRRVAVLGGMRIPFARQNGPYAQASNQDMFTAALDALVDKFGLQAEVLGRHARLSAQLLEPLDEGFRVRIHVVERGFQRCAIRGERRDAHTLECYRRAGAVPWFAPCSATRCG